MAYKKCKYCQEKYFIIHGFLRAQEKKKLAQESFFKRTHRSKRHGNIIAANHQY